MEFASGNIFVRLMGGNDGLKPGHVIAGHTHNFDHTSIFFGGRWRVKRWRAAVNESGAQLEMPDGAPAWVMMDDFERDGPFYLLIEAGCRHEFTFVKHVMPEWMQKYISQLSLEQSALFADDYAKSLGKAWCVYSHRTPQGDVVETASGWNEPYI